MEIHRRVRWVPPLLLSAFLSTAATGSQEHAVSYGQTEERVIGLLEVPEILGEVECKDFQPRRINFYGMPSKDRPSTGTIEVRPHRIPEDPDCYFGKVIVRRSAAGSSDEELPTEEVGYEVKAAVVYERNGPWFRIALAKGSAWIERAGTIDFLAYPAGLSTDEHLTYLRQGWDGRIWPAAGAAASVEAPRGWQAHRARSLPIQVLSTRTINREIWVQIRFETEERCGQTLEGVTPLEGWIPAYRQNATSVWFSSRGC